MDNKLKINIKGASKSTIILSIVAVVVIATFAIFSVYAIKGNDGSGSATTNLNNANANTPDGEFQTATLKFINYEYVLEPNALKKDVPVQLTVDTNTVRGCMRDIVISEFGVRKYVSPSDNIIEFTPDKEGTFWIVCSMNMGQGTFRVLANPDSTAQFASVANSENTSRPPLLAGSDSCGMTSSGGGCGCGRR